MTFSKNTKGLRCKQTKKTVKKKKIPAPNMQNKGKFAKDYYSVVVGGDKTLGILW